MCELFWLLQQDVDHEIVNQAIKDSQVLQTKENFHWDWDLITAILKVGVVLGCFLISFWNQNICSGKQIPWVSGAEPSIFKCTDRSLTYSAPLYIHHTASKGVRVAQMWIVSTIYWYCDGYLMQGSLFRMWMDVYITAKCQLHCVKR